MSTTQFLKTQTQVAPGALIPVSALQKAYRAAGGKESRTTFIIGLTKEGYKVSDWYGSVAVVEGLSLKA